MRRAVSKRKTAEEPYKEITVKCTDGAIVAFPIIDALTVPLLKTVLQLPGSEEEPLALELESTGLELIKDHLRDFRFYRDHHGGTAPYEAFLQNTRKQLSLYTLQKEASLHVLVCAGYLRMKELVETLAEHMANKMNEMSISQLRDFLDITTGFSSEEEKALLGELTGLEQGGGLL